MGEGFYSVAPLWNGFFIAILSTAPLILTVQGPQSSEPRIATMREPTGNSFESPTGCPCLAPLILLFFPIT